MTTSARMSALALFGSVSAIGLAAPVWAQDAPAAAPVEEGKLQEIVVTAEKRGQDLQKTPIAITAITAQQIQLQRITQVRDISALAPNVSVLGGTTSNAAAVVSIRGIPSSADETQGFDSPIGIYLDGVYLARSAAATFDVAEIERVEVLRGPQGTLFGRNTTGGAINFITKRPSDKFGVEGEVGYGNYNAWNAKATVNTGKIGDLIKMSLSYLHRARDGYVNNPLQSNSRLDPGGLNTDGARFAAVLTPADGITITNIFDYTNVKGVPYANQLAAVGNGAVRPNQTIDGGVFVPVQPANVGGFLNESTIEQAGCGKTISVAYQSRVCGDTARPSTDTVWGDMFRVEADLGFAQLRSTTAYRHWHSVVRGSDLDGLGTINGPVFTQATTLNGMPQSVLSQLLPAGTAAFLAGQPVPRQDLTLATAHNNRGQHQISQELELVSKSGGPFQWVVGGFFFHEAGYETNPQTLGFILDTNQSVFTSANFGALAPLLQANNPERYRAAITQSTLSYRAGGTSYAVYGQGTYRPGSGKLGLTVGLRYTWDEKTFSRTQNGATPYTSAADIALNHPDPAHFHAPTGNATLDYRATPDINLYARVARGYRSGGFNARQTTDAASGLGLKPFNNETIWSYEAGIKTQFFNRLRLNASAFYNNYSNLQVNAPIPIASGGSFGTQVVNAGKVRYEGVELEGQLQVDDHISLDGNFGYVHVKYLQYLSPDSTGVERNIASVVTPGYAPKYTANIGATAQYPINDDTRIVGRIGWSYVSGFVEFGNELTAPFSDQTRSTAHGLLNGQIRLENLKLGFGPGVDLTVWGKNLTNKKWVSRSVDFGQLGFATVIYGDPRTFGATLGFKF